ncbi:MAG: cystathionine beta-synthase, partial [Shewanella sp.]
MKYLLSILLLIKLLFFIPFANSTPWENLSTEQLEHSLEQKFTAGQYSSKGADTCLMCHKKNDKVMAIFDGKHGDMSHSNSPMA